MAPPNYPRREDEEPSAETSSKASASSFFGESDTPPSVRVVESVADALETAPEELGPLYEAIDPDALDRLFESPHRFASGRVTFAFEGRTVTVDADGRIDVSPGEDD
ncbi:HalOD1 output domain-containing protein [Halorubrum sp. CSM-61]|uniref:HalOD1 output domain-containing protein n=1 Tax=Halorubrum sp. CSM-61 TaxID=2485838 RepID=UPI0013DDC0B1|nr:HalOD1 output domain-containing protein [Halorubrum sp. CSM-61]